MTAPKYFKVDQKGETLIFSAVDAIGGLVEDEARVEWDALLEQLSEREEALREETGEEND